MKHLLIVLAAVLISLPMGGMAEENNITITNHTDIFKFSINTTYIGFDSNWFASNILVNVTTIKFGRSVRMVYLEEYFTVDSKNNPKPVISKTYYDSHITENISFQILRPLSRSGKFYSMIRGVILIDGKRMYEKWLKTANGANLTFTIGKENDQINNQINNIDKFEVKNKNLLANLSVVYRLTTQEIPIYEVDITSMENDGDTSLRVNLLKGRPTFVPVFPWISYKYIDISIDTNKIDKVILKYRVENSWIKNVNLSSTDIRIFRWNKDDRKWHSLQTRIIGKNKNYTFYQSEGSNLSIFVIGEINKTIRDEFINTIIANKNNSSIDINQKINELDNKTNVSEKEKLPKVGNGNGNLDNKYLNIGKIGLILSIITIIISTYVIIKNRRLQKRLGK